MKVRTIIDTPTL